MKCLVSAKRFRFNEEREFILPYALGITFKEDHLSGWTYDKCRSQNIERRKSSLYRTQNMLLDTEMQRERHIWEYNVARIIIIWLWPDKASKVKNNYRVLIGWRKIAKRLLKDILCGGKIILENNNNEMILEQKVEMFCKSEDII